ncbi:uncharacterized protein IUM83_16148 [Phytophthora cinnamomi]|uniref:uncharacterized protein n=1 Tax=Phytophthora cinnamomi TaxID=4785 RepID=UPI003559C9EE|nr:hypothetical protein IUM83_16148 [Phytophthora cinnamomi]
MKKFLVPLDSYAVRLSLVEGSVPLLGALAPLLELLHGPPSAENPVPCVVLRVQDSQLFNAVDEIANVFLEQGILTGILASLRAGQRGLFVPVPVPGDSTIGIISGKMEQLAASVGADVHMRVEDFASLAASTSDVFDMLLRTVLKFQLLSSGCLQFEKRDEAPQVLMTSEPHSGEVPTTAILNVQLVTDSAGRPVIELECVPKMLLLQTVAEPTGSSSQRRASVMVLPRLGRGWLVSRFSNNPVSYLAAGLDEDWSHYKARIAEDVKPNKRAQPLSCSLDRQKGFHRYAPQTDEEFRRYWLGVHRIRLPEDFGGYAHVSFSSRLKFTYPACCVASLWTILLRETCAKSVEIIEQFQFLLQVMIGKKAITVGRAIEPPNSTNLLPAIGSISAELLQPMLFDLESMKNETSQNQYKGQLAEDVNEQKVIKGKKQRKQHAEAPRVKSQSVKSQRGEKQRVKTERMK